LERFFFSSILVELGKIVTSSNNYLVKFLTKSQVVIDIKEKEKKKSMLQKFSTEKKKKKKERRENDRSYLENDWLMEVTFLIALVCY
jgi:hypothetical protein